jgi:hypothetical protein
MKEKSKFVPVGMVFFAISLIVPPIIPHIAKYVQGDADILKISVRLILMSVDLFLLCFFIGITCMLIGYLRNRKNRKKEQPPELIPFDESE